jgi:Fe-S-cluster-containing dehydrogenase component
VEACPTAARIFGDISDLDSEIKKLVESSNVQILKSWAHTDPEIYYKNLPKEADI